MIKFNQAISSDLEAASRREWIETNGLGGFASSTVAGLNTRRYHGLLVAATKPPVGRMVLLSKLEETLVLGDRRIELSANSYPGVIHPQGFRHLKEFRLDPFPIFTYEVEGIELIKSVFMISGENSVVVSYEARDRASHQPAPVLELRPLIAFRDYHSTTHENSSLNPALQVETGLVSITPYEGLPALHFAHDGQELIQDRYWYRSFEYEAERERGLDFQEDLFSPFALRFELARGGGAATVIASTERRDAGRVFQYRQSEIQRRSDIVSSSPVDDDLVRSLVAAADQYIVARGEKKTVIAGYHWFSDWGRDTMIALPGLTLVTGHAEVAKSIITEFVRHLDRGMLPNRFPDEGEEPEYNTVDATLWLFEAGRALLSYTQDTEFVRANLYEALRGIIDWHVEGTRYGIRLDEDGLLQSGEEGVQLTWMDAKVGDYVVTPRKGKPVEIEALWYNALRVMEELAREFGDTAYQGRITRMAALAKRSFNTLFWNEGAACLYDVINGELRDGSIRPNQILAVSLHHSMLARERAKQVVAVVERDLLTPFGLRSLAPYDARYRARYEGDPWQRDTSYHQGTVWAWLMGPFITAYIKVNNKRPQASRARASEWLASFSEHLSDAGLNQISEIFDAESPHLPRGCIAQAWSVAELLRASVEDIYNIRPDSRKALAAH